MLADLGFTKGEAGQNTATSYGHQTITGLQVLRAPTIDMKRSVEVTPRRFAAGRGLSSCANPRRS
jgi:hypothetical protein